MSKFPNKTTQPVKVVFLEDDVAFATHICLELEALNYVVMHFTTGRECLSHILLHDCDICLFDWNLPDMPGTDVMAHLWKIRRMPPVIFMTGNDAEQDIAKVLLAGADDYIVKPPSICILHARIQAVLRKPIFKEETLSKEILGNLVIDYYNKVILRSGEPVSLTGTEAVLAFNLFMNRGQIVTRQHLYELLGINSMVVDTRRLDVHISHIRRKLGLNVMNGWKLSSIFQRGYRLEYFKPELK